MSTRISGGNTIYDGKNGGYPGAKPDVACRTYDLEQVTGCVPSHWVLRPAIPGPAVDRLSQSPALSCGTCGGGGNGGGNKGDTSGCDGGMTVDTATLQA